MVRNQVWSSWILHVNNFYVLEIQDFFPNYRNWSRTGHLSPKPYNPFKLIAASKTNAGLNLSSALVSEDRFIDLTESKKWRFKELMAQILERTYSVFFLQILGGQLKVIHIQVWFLEVESGFGGEPDIPIYFSWKDGASFFLNLLLVIRSVLWKRNDFLKNCRSK